jgi:hypothetical protein
MSTRRTVQIGLWGRLAVVSLLVLAAGPLPAQAQQPPAAVVSAITGRVEVLSKGQTAWQAARLGTRVFEGDEVRAFAGASAELRLPDTSIVSVAENSRFVVTKLDYTPQNQMRAAIFHLAVGKIRGFIAQAAVRLVQARQNTFAISTPTAVAAVRGSEVFASFDPATGATTFYVSSGTVTIVDVRTGQRLTLTAGQIISFTAGQALPAQPSTATDAQKSQMTSNAQPPSASGALNQGGPTVFTVSPDQVLSVAAAAAGAPPTVVVTPAPPPRTRETQPSPF